MIKNIIFDFGGIFINLDQRAVFNELSKFGYTEISIELDTLAKTYEKGLISSSDFISELHKQFRSASPPELKKAWNAIIADFPENRLTFIESLAAENTYRLFLLSNTNELHIARVVETMGLERFNRFKSCFEQVYLSHEINLRKPDANSYAYVLASNNLLPEETFFIDDSKTNTDAALALGIKCWNLQVGQESILDLKTKLHL